MVGGSVGGRAGRCRRRWCGTGLCQQVPRSPRRRGAGAKGNTTKSRLVGLAAGQERCTAWRRGTQARPVAPLPRQRANSARRNPPILLGSSTESIQVVRCGGRDGRGGLKSYYRSSHRLGAVAARRDGYRKGRRGGRSGGHSDGQTRSRPWDSWRGERTSSGWTRGPAGPEVIINSRWLGAGGDGCFPVRPSGDETRRRQGSRRCRVALRRRGGRGRMNDLDGVGSL